MVASSAWCPLSFPSVWCGRCALVAQALLSAVAALQRATGLGLSWGVAQDDAHSTANRLKSRHRSAVHPARAYRMQFIEAVARLLSGWRRQPVRRNGGSNGEGGWRDRRSR